MKVKAKETGLFLSLDENSIFSIGSKGVELLTRASTIEVLESGETPDAPPTRRKIPLWRMQNSHLVIPKGILHRVNTPWEWEITLGIEERQKLCLRNVCFLPVTLEEAQEEILRAVQEFRSSGCVVAAMGAGKSWILMALALCHPLLRPCAISGKGEKDTRQLLQKLKEIFENNPQIAEPVMLSGLGRQLSKRDRLVLESGEGIVICTHAGLQNLPENTKLLILDEAHAAATPKRINNILRLRNSLKKAFALTGTLELRGDGGDELLQALIGPKIISKGHEEFEKTGRVTPVWIKGYHFNGRGIYAENPYIPCQVPQAGYSLHATWVENHRGRHIFVADLVMSLPEDETKIIFVPHILHAVRICKAIEQKIIERFGDLSHPKAAALRPHIFHAKADKRDKFYMSKEERAQKIGALTKGEIKLALATDFLSTGFDTNTIDHVIDASGQKAIITNIQRSGRGTRPRKNPDGSLKVLEIHTILDKTHPVLHKLGESKFAALCAYYNHRENAPPNPERQGGVIRYVFPPWIRVEEKGKLESLSSEKNFQAKGINSFDPKEFRK